MFVMFNSVTSLSLTIEGCLLIRIFADKASKVFFENVKFLKIIDSNNKLIFNQAVKADDGNGVKEDPKIPPPPPSDGEENLFTLPIPLDTKRKAYIKYPLNDLKKKDIKVIVKALSFIASSILEEGEDDFEIKIVETKKE